MHCSARIQIQKDDGGMGNLKETLFKDCLKALDLGISAGNQVELLKALRSKGADTIDYGCGDHALLLCYNHWM